MAEILFWESNTRCHHQLYSGLWTSRCLVLNILARRDLFSTERSNVQHQQDLRPRFLQLISVFVFDACRHIERRTELLKQLSDPVKYDLSSLFRFFLFLAKFRSVYKEKKQVTHFILYIKKPHGEIDHKTIVIIIITIIIIFMIIMIMIIIIIIIIIIIMIGYIFQSFVLLSVIRLILSCARFLLWIAYFVALNRIWS